MLIDAADHAMHGKRYHTAALYLEQLLGWHVLNRSERKRLQRMYCIAMEAIQYRMQERGWYDLVHLPRKCLQKQKKVLLTVTTCRRLAHFLTSFSSFLHCCADFYLIDAVFIVDDNSSQEDRQKMQNMLPWCTFYFKTPEQRGHGVSMEIIRQEAMQYKYWVQMEDDWLFVQRCNMIKPAIELMKRYPFVANVQFARMYAEYLSLFDYDLVGSTYLDRIGPAEFELHQYSPLGSEDQLEKVRHHGELAKYCHWPHFSLRPGVIKTSVLKELGPFSQENCEFEYAYQYMKAGYKTAYFSDILYHNIGKGRWNDTESNAYQLNKTDK